MRNGGSGTEVAAGDFPSKLGETYLLESANEKSAKEKGAGSGPEGVRLAGKP